MNFYSVVINGQEIKFRIIAQHHAELEKLLGCSLMDAVQVESKMLNNLDLVSKVLYIALKPFSKEQGEFTTEKVKGLYDDLVDMGYNVETFPELVMEIGEVSGFFPKGTAEGMKAKLESKKPAQNPEV